MLNLFFKYKVAHSNSKHKKALTIVVFAVFFSTAINFSNRINIVFYSVYVIIILGVNILY